jgi:hypothetical protein
VLRDACCEEAYFRDEMNSYCGTMTCMYQTVTVAAHIPKSRYFSRVSLYVGVVNREFLYLNTFLL